MANKIERVGDELVLKARFNLSWNDFYKTIPGHRWDPEVKSWRFPYSPHILEIIRNVVVPLEVDPELEGNTDKKELEAKRKWIDDEFTKIRNTETRYISKTVPFKHQMIAWDFIKDRRSSALLMEMGTGKTKTMIDALNYIWVHKHNKDLFRILWVCPTSVMYNAKKEFELHSANPFTAEIVEGLKNRRVRTIEQATKSADNQLMVLIVNYEAVRTLEQALERYNPHCIVLDESTKIKNPHAQCSKALYDLGKKAKYKYIMTGTSITQSPVDIYSQYKFLDSDIFGTSFMTFKANYVVMGGWENREIVGYRNIEEMKQKIFSIGIRFAKKECLDLPDKIYERRYFELTDEQKRVYNSMRKDLVAEYQGGMITAQVAIVKILRLSQICSGFVRMDTNLESEDKDLNLLQTFSDNPKLTLLKETMEDIGEEKIVIWCRFIKEITMIKELCHELKRKCYPFYGAVEKSERSEILEAFNKEKTPSIFIGQIQTGGLGINLTSGHHVIYFSNSYSLADRLQSEDRTHRIGQGHNCLYFDLVGKGTIEESVLKVLRKKLEISSVLTKDTLNQILEGEF